MIIMGDIPVSGFTRVVVLSLHVEILEMQVGSHECEEFERGLLEEYEDDKSLRSDLCFY